MSELDVAVQCLILEEKWRNGDGGEGWRKALGMCDSFLITVQSGGADTLPDGGGTAGGSRG